MPVFKEEKKPTSKLFSLSFYFISSFLFLGCGVPSSDSEIETHSPETEISSPVAPEQPLDDGFLTPKNEEADSWKAQLDNMYVQDTELETNKDVSLSLTTQDSTLKWEHRLKK